ncbi:CAF1 family ribonuclease containing protein [Trichomonas vaginalis G3]|uniref:poly(A)-specific ribonuclease n=1 Tax=Trichomonas vaginalis (strain ATCC PRA-98 / G3) TaxID=412133 RepID=A2FEP7_TRIV3|nr:exonucleolytic nuclear-transcribed mRNA catabolic process involved in deadenylation-dependent decay [Trichomonas vaginalis G3]EAX96627.1 CAF1 family ribonuclease containing protein [Trichomonas vaginalis G3]KAI5532900.1 exonucleolytic nuclear-transcribed mRNA catabolic process involved in deadenylation-dependent decay [Trichomonas vaginalis G3]|eukprot:XP_001309557.1 CAF1 family ribonuclease containing protein [Trichomonas vaginalis G3]
MEKNIRDVWAHNLEDEMKKISELIEDYPYIAMDTEFPGQIAKPFGSFSSQEDYVYQLTRLNVDYLKIIQIGITLGDGQGGYPQPCSTWQFNFKFNLDEDMYTSESIELLQQSGIDFKRFNNEGISPFDFTQLLYTSGLVMNDRITYLTYHSVSDFAYLLKMLTCKPLPPDVKDFNAQLNILFPHYYDIKLIASNMDLMGGGLQALANELNVPRVGPAHQAGSDALVTLDTFVALMNKYFGGKLENEKFENKIYSI